MRESYDTVAATYAELFGDELAGKPLDRALLAAFAETVRGPVADVGCGPGHVTRYLAARHPDVVGIDLSPRMVEIAREHAPQLPFTAASMLALPVPAAAWAGAVAMYSVIHLNPAERTRAWDEFARVVRPGGHLLVAFHVNDPDTAIGASRHLTSWFDEAVDVDVQFLDPDAVERELTGAGFAIAARLDRLPDSAVEHPSRRCYLLARRD